MSHNGSPTSIDDILVSRSRESPSHRFLLRPEQDDTADTPVQEITYGAFDTHVSRLAHTWMTKQANGDLVGSPIHPRAIIGVFLPSGYALCVTIFALVRLGAVPFCLSPRNSDEALKHLVRTENVVAIVLASEGALTSRMKKTLQDGDMHVPILDVVKDILTDLSSGPKTFYPSLPPGVVSVVDVAVQLHTSGSTALPKPVPLSHELLLRALQGGTWWVDGFNTQSDVALAHSPVFHISGLIGGLLNAMLRGHTLAIPPLPPTDNGGLSASSQTLLTYAQRVHATELFSVPNAIVALARSDGGLDLLKSMKRVLAVGASIPREDGNWMVQHGVHIIEGVGSTEGGSLLHSNRPAGDTDWQALRVCWNLPHHFDPLGSAPHTVYELVLHPFASGSIISGADPKTGYFRTHDLFQEYPRPGSGTWRHCGRTDDFFQLQGSQKWNPRPAELQIESSPVVQNAVIFGDGRPYLGVLITPHNSSEPGSLVQKLRDEEKEAVWSAIQFANNISQSDAQIGRKSVLVVTAQGVLPLDSDVKSSNAGLEVKRIPIGDKGIPLRQKTYELFKAEIDLMYNGAR